MKIPKRIMGKISRIIKDTSALYSQAIPDTQRHLFPQLLFGLLTTTSAYASDVVRKIEGTSIGAKEMRVLRFAHHPKLYHTIAYYRLTYNVSQGLWGTKITNNSPGFMETCQSW